MIQWKLSGENNLSKTMLVSHYVYVFGEQNIVDKIIMPHEACIDRYGESTLCDAKAPKSSTFSCASKKRIRRSKHGTKFRHLR